MAQAGCLAVHDVASAQKLLLLVPLQSTLHPIVVGRSDLTLVSVTAGAELLSCRRQRPARAKAPAKPLAAKPLAKPPALSIATAGVACLAARALAARARAARARAARALALAAR